MYELDHVIMRKSAKKRSRRWLQFGLRGLLLATMVVGVAAVALRWYLEPYRRQYVARAVIARLGGSYTAEEADTWLRRWTGLSRILGYDLQNIVVVDVANCDTPDAYLDYIVDLPMLRTLVVGGTNFDDSYLHRLSSIRSLQWLVSDCTSISDEGSVQLQTAVPGLQVHRSQHRAIAFLARLRQWEGEPEPSSPDQIHKLGWETQSSLPSVELARDIDSRHFLVAKNGGVQGMDLRTAEQTQENLQRISSSVFANLEYLVDVEELQLLYLEPFGGDLAHLSRLNRLQFLSLAGTSVRDRDLSHLRPLAAWNDCRWMERKSATMAYNIWRRLRT